MDRMSIGRLLARMNLGAALTAFMPKGPNDGRIMDALGIRGNPKPKKIKVSRRSYRKKHEDVAAKYHSEQAIAAAIRRAVKWGRHHNGDFENAPAHIYEKMNLAQEVLS